MTAFEPTMPIQEKRLGGLPSMHDRAPNHCYHPLASFYHFPKHVEDKRGLEIAPESLHHALNARWGYIVRILRKGESYCR
jgi:hypothetical protein